MRALSLSSLRDASRRLIGSAARTFDDLQPRYHTSDDGKVTAGRGVQGLRHARFEGLNAVGRDTMIVGPVEIGYASTVGATSVLYGPARIGRYSQLGPAVALYGRDHPMQHMSTYINRALFDGRLATPANFSEVVIGSDVWIGHGAVVLRGVSVGNGAIIGAGAVITSNVPDYAIVVGNPGRVIRKRFAEDIVGRLVALRWWELTVEQLAPLEPLFHVDFTQERDRALHLLDGAVHSIRRTPDPIRTSGSESATERVS